MSSSRWQATIDEVKDYFVKSFVRRLLDDLLGQLAALKPWETGKKTQARALDMALRASQEPFKS